MKHEIVQFTSVLLLDFKRNMLNALYWLEGHENIQPFILAQRPCVLYWLKGPEFYTGSTALQLIHCFILAQRP